MNASSMLQFREQIMMKINNLASNEGIYMPKYDQSELNQRMHHIAEASGATI
jgi:hypothetical protein